MSMLYLGDTKRCSKCKKYKPFSEYHKSKSAPRGIVAACKECVNKAHRKYRDRRDRFWKYFHSHTILVNECLEWTGRYTNKHPCCSWEGRDNFMVRRLVYHLSLGVIPSNMFVIMTCKNPRCVRQSHLVLATRQDVEVKRCNSTATGDQHGAYTHPEKRAKGDRNGSRLHPDRLARGDRHGSRLHPECLKRGESNGQSKLNAAAVCYIRSLPQIKHGDLTALARQFGVGRTAIRQVLDGKTWKHVDVNCPYTH